MSETSSTPVAIAAPLAGMNLIEASAGTGKTWTIAGLYVRLLVERELPIEKILVMTFTRAATAELKERLRRKIADLAAHLGGERPDEPGASDPFLPLICRRIDDRRTAIVRLNAALRGFDRAAIFTIHGFCQRVLEEHAFGCAAAFGGEVLSDIRDLTEAVVADFWRRNVAAPREGFSNLSRAAHERFADWLLEREDPENLASWLDAALRHRPDRIDRLPVPEDAAGRITALPDLWEEVRQAWLRQRNEAVDVLLTSKSMNRRSYHKGNIGNWSRRIDELVEREEAPVTWKEDHPFLRFTRNRIAGALTSADAAPPTHPFFDLAQHYVHHSAGVHEAYRALRQALLGDLLREGEWELAGRLKRQRLLSYDSLLVQVHAALTGAAGGTLAGALREQFPAVLVDEFQDTDPLQWAILHRIYADAPGEAIAAYLVGDPKQAIYGFRGADVYAYLEARRHASARFPLTENHRSVPALIRALNHLFSGEPGAFRVAEIPYADSTAAEKPYDRLREDLRYDAAPLRFHVLPPNPDGSRRGTRSKEEATRWAADTVAGEIARLLGLAESGRLTLGERPLEARDIAVLVGTHRQGIVIREALRTKGILAVEQSRESVFASEEAEALERLLLALEQPERESWVRGALATPLLGYDGDGLARLLQDEARWSEILEDFRTYQSCWRDAGFIAMFRRLLREHQVISRLIRLPDGERRLTNLFHLAELLQAESRRRVGLSALLAWFAGQRRERPEGEEALLRLESDEKLVQILTVHVAKGLEFPVTFVPYLWDSAVRARMTDTVFFHDPNRARVLDLGTGRAQAQGSALLEAQAEALRLAYVALTRAKNRCYVTFGAINGAEHSPLAWLLDRDRAAQDCGTAAIHELAEATQGAVAVVEPEPAAVLPPAPPALRRLAARELRRAVPAAWRLASYSTLSRAVDSAFLAELPEHDETAPGAEPTPVPPGGGRFAFPRGEEAGTHLHGILETIDFTAAPRDWSEAIQERLTTFGKPVEWTSDTRAWLAEALATPLTGSPDGRIFSLNQVPPARTLRELEFHLPLAADPSRLSGALARHGLAVRRMASERIEGFLKGYIDLVFEHAGRYYLADYKSNWLGGTPADYRPARLEAAMVRGNYHLQYALYAVALHRYLAQRLPEYAYEHHFGGVFYLFLRGMHPDFRDESGHSHGVYRTRPPLALLQELDGLLDPARGFPA